MCYTHVTHTKTTTSDETASFRSAIHESKNKIDQKLFHSTNTELNKREELNSKTEFIQNQWEKQEEKEEEEKTQNNIRK